jgi:hypothetical protein
VNWDHYTMTQVVPWIPWRWGVSVTVTGSSVTKWVFDQFSGYIGWAHIAVNNKIDPSTLSV